MANTADIDDLLDEALEDFVPQKVLHSGSSAANTSALVSAPFQPLPDKPLKKPTSKGSKKFAPLPDRKKHKEAGQVSRMGPIISNDNDARGRPSMEAIPEGEGDLYQSFAKLIQELDSASAAGDAQKGDLSETLRAMAQQSAELRSHEDEPSAGQPDSMPRIPGEPMFAGLQEQFGGSEGGFGGLADTLMRQLLSKEVLYQPMKDIGERYPEWLAAHRDTLSPEELQQYEEQHRHINEILEIYRKDPENYSELFNALQQMQACGQPPQDIVNDLAPGMAFDDEGLPRGFPGTPAGPGLGCCLQ